MSGSDTSSSSVSFSSEDVSQTQTKVNILQNTLRTFLSEAAKLKSAWSADLASGNPEASNIVEDIVRLTSEFQLAREEMLKIDVDIEAMPDYLDPLFLAPGIRSLQYKLHKPVATLNHIIEAIGELKTPSEKLTAFLSHLANLKKDLEPLYKSLTETVISHLSDLGNDDIRLGRAVLIMIEDPKIPDRVFSNSSDTFPELETLFPDVMQAAVDRTVWFSAPFVDDRTHFPSLAEVADIYGWFTELNSQIEENSGWPTILTEKAGVAADELEEKAAAILQAWRYRLFSAANDHVNDQGQKDVPLAAQQMLKTLNVQFSKDPNPEAGYAYLLFKSIQKRTQKELGKHSVRVQCDRVNLLDIFKEYAGDELTELSQLTTGEQRIQQLQREFVKLAIGYALAGLEASRVNVRRGEPDGNTYQAKFVLDNLAELPDADAAIAFASLWSSKNHRCFLAEAFEEQTPETILASPVLSGTEKLPGKQLKEELVAYGIYAAMAKQPNPDVSRARAFLDAVDAHGLDKANVLAKSASLVPTERSSVLGTILSFCTNAASRGRSESMAAGAAGKAPVRSPTRSIATKVLANLAADPDAPADIVFRVAHDLKVHKELGETTEAWSLCLEVHFAARIAANKKRGVSVVDTVKAFFTAAITDKLLNAPSDTALVQADLNTILNVAFAKLAHSESVRLLNTLEAELNPDSPKMRPSRSDSSGSLSSGSTAKRKTSFSGFKSIKARFSNSSGDIDASNSIKLELIRDARKAEQHHFNEDACTFVCDTLASNWLAVVPETESSLASGTAGSTSAPVIMLTEPSPQKKLTGAMAGHSVPTLPISGSSAASLTPAERARWLTRARTVEAEIFTAAAQAAESDQLEPLYELLRAVNAFTVIELPDTSDFALAKSHQNDLTTWLNHPEIAPIVRDIPAKSAPSSPGRLARLRRGSSAGDDSDKRSTRSRSPSFFRRGSDASGDDAAVAVTEGRTARTGSLPVPPLRPRRSSASSASGSDQ